MKFVGAMKPQRSRLTARDLLWIGCSWMLGSWAMFAALDLPSRGDQTAGIIVAMAVVVTLTYLLARAVGEREAGSNPDVLEDP